MASNHVLTKVSPNLGTTSEIGVPNSVVDGVQYRRYCVVAADPLGSDNPITFQLHGLPGLSEVRIPLRYWSFRG